MDWGDDVVARIVAAMRDNGDPDAVQQGSRPSP
jgi:hypothetical protein